MKTAIIGVGNWGKNLLKELDKQSEVVHACHTGSTKSIETLSSYAHIKSITDPEIIFTDPEIQAVVIATPTEKHFELAQRALEAGKHVLLEKPGTTGPEQLQKLCDLAQEKKLNLGLGYEFPHHPAAQELKKLIGSGEINSIDFNWLKWGTFKDHSIPHLLCHDISLMFFFGLKNLEPTDASVWKVISSSDMLDAQFRSDKTYIHSYINRVNPMKQKTVTLVTDKNIYLWKDNELFTISDEPQKLTPIQFNQSTPLEGEIKDFLSSIQEKRKPLIDGNFGVEVYKIIEKISSKIG